MPPAPRSIYWLTILLPTAAVMGAVEVAVGAMQLARLSTNRSAALAAADSNDVSRAIGNLASSAHASLVVGGVAILLVVGPLLVRKKLRLGAPLLWVLGAAVLLGNLVMVADASVGLTAYSADDAATTALVNDLLIAPGRSVLLYPAEAVIIALLVWIGVLLISDDTREFLRIRSEPAADPTWNTILAAHRNRQETGDSTATP